MVWFNVAMSLRNFRKFEVPTSAVHFEVLLLGTVTGGYISESHSLQRQVLGSVGQSHKRNSNSHGCSGHFWPIEFEGTECVQALCFGNEHASQI